MIARGLNQRNMLSFALKYPGWHTFNTRDKATKSAAQALQSKGLIKIMGDQFKAS